MAVKIRLKRLGKIRAPYYRIVVADSRTKRDGRVIEEIGKYHPTEEPSFIEVDSERAQPASRRNLRLNRLNRMNPARSWAAARPARRTAAPRTRRRPGGIHSSPRPCGQQRARNSFPKALQPYSPRPPGGPGGEARSAAA